MSTIPPLVAPTGSVEVYYPSEDGEPMAETGIHMKVMVKLVSILETRFRHRLDVHVTGNIFLYYEEGHPELCRSPDVMVIKGVPSTPERPSFKTWEEKAVPCVVIEVTSAKTKDEDQGPKKDLYERLGVREYFLFDPLNEYLPRPLIGYRLIRKVDEHSGENGSVVAEYEELPPDGEGGLISSELGLRLVPEGTQLALFDYNTGHRLLSLEETTHFAEQLRLKHEQAEQDAKEERRQREQAERDAEQQRLKREQAERDAEQERRQREQAERDAKEQRLKREQAERDAEQERRQREQAERAVEQGQQQVDEVRQQAEKDQKRADRAEIAVEQERKQAEGAIEHERRLRQQVEQELARLRALLPPDPPPTGGS